MFMLRKVLPALVAVGAFAALPAVATASAYNDVVVQSSPAAYWPLDDPAGSSTAADVTGNGHDASLFGGVTPGSPPLITTGTSFSIDGTGYLAPQNSGALLTSPVSFELWAEPTAVGSYQTIMSDEGDNGSNGYGFRLRAEGSYWFVMGGAGYGEAASSAPGVAQNGQVAYLVGTFDGSTLNLYVNGVLAGTIASTRTPNSNLPLNIGRFPDGQEYFSGSIDEVAVYNHVLSPAEVLNHYCVGSGNTTGICTPPTHPTSTTVSCTPSSVVAPNSTTCTATVSDTASSGQTTPNGTVTFASSGQGSFSNGGQCTLAGTGGSASCSVSYSPTHTSTTPVRSDTITGSYGGDTGHNPSSGTTQVTVISLPTSKDQCKNGGWQQYGVFKNQGDCVSYVATGGKNAAG
jgi:hypothetical protein